MYRRAHDLTEACDALASGTYRIVAGATDLYASPVEEAPGELLDISPIDALRRMELGGREIRIGATVTWSAIRRAPLPRCMDALKQAAATIGGVQIQNRGTIGGNICNASPAADGVLALMALGAEIEIISREGRRRLPLAELFMPGGGVRLGRHELLESIVTPCRPGRTSSFLKLGRRRDLAISVLASAVAVDWTRDGRIAALTACVGAASRIPARLPGLEKHLVGVSPLDHRGPLATIEDVVELSPIDDIRASASYRRQAAVVLLDRVLRQAAEERDHA